VWQVTAALSLAGMYVYTGGSSAHWHEGAVQTVYLLSKWTDLYAEAMFQRASDGTHATINTNDPSSGRIQLMIATGVRHHF
jgi:GBP family porin